MAEQWKQKALSHWDLINRLAVRRFGTRPLAEEAALFVMDSLAADSWRRLQDYTGKGSFKSYLASLSWRLLEDFSRKRFGRVRPPLWVSKLGGMWALLFSLLCLQRLSLHDAVESASCHHSAWDKEELTEEQELIHTQFTGTYINFVPKQERHPTEANEAVVDLETSPESFSFPLFPIPTGTIVSVTTTETKRVCQLTARRYSVKEGQKNN